MSLNIADNFSYRGQKPLDQRLVFDTLIDMASVASSEVYTGLLSFNLENNTFYIYDDSNTSDAVTGKWREFSVSSGSGSAEISEYKENTEYKLNELIYLGEKVCRVASSFTSSNLGNVQDSFEEDINRGNLVTINSASTSILNSYLQGNFYLEGTLLYFEDYILRVLKDFTADNSNPLPSDSLYLDVANGNLLILNRETIPGILPYNQGTFFNKDKLVFADGRIGRVLKDYISDTTGTTLEESINIDIHNGNLREMAENYKFKLYKTTQDLNKTIDSVNTLKISDIVFENGESIGNMQLNEGVYGPLGTLAIITNIDKNTQTIDVKTVNSREMEFMPPAPEEYSVDITVGGSGYAIGDSVKTSLSEKFYAIVDSVDENGSICEVTLVEGESSYNSSGYGAIIVVSPTLYVGHSKNWIELSSTGGSNSESASKIELYVPGNIYKKDSLVYFETIEYRSVIDFQASTTEDTDEENLNIDIQQGYLVRMTPEPVDIPEFIGTIMSDSEEDLDLISDPVSGNWGLVIDCKITAPGQPGIAVYSEGGWNITPIPQGELQFPEPTDIGKRYFRVLKSDGSDTSGTWEAFTSVSGDDIELTVNTTYLGTDVPKLGELCWSNNTLLVGDGNTDLMGLKPFYSTAMSRDDLINLIGFEPESINNKGKADGYAPLDSNGLVPKANLPIEVTDTYSKVEIDSKDTEVLNSATLLVNTESIRATSKETEIETNLNNHILDTSLHVSQTEKDSWNAKVEEDDLLEYDNHISDLDIHVTQEDKDKWDGMNKAYFVHSVEELPLEGNQIGNIGYVQTSAAGVVPIVCDQYMWNGNSWEKVDTSGVSLTFNWGNLQGKPASTPLTIDNAVNVAHKHVNFNVLEKIGQSPTGEFTWNDKPIGIQAVFLNNENSLPDVGEENVLYIVYEDARVRNFPSISVYRNDAFQILGRGTQDAPPTVGEMSILQAEYFSVKDDSVFNITISPQTSFCFLPVEILAEQLGQEGVETKVVDTLTQKIQYNENLFDQSNVSGLTFNVKSIPIENDTVSDMYFGHTLIDLNDYYDIVSIG